VSQPRRVAVMGVTGSIGRQSLDVLRRADQFELVAVSAGRRLDDLVAIVEEFRVPRVGVPDEASARQLAERLGSRVQVVVGDAGLAELCRDADVVVNAVVGFAGLPVTLATLEAGRRLALANKESLIAAAPLVERVRSTPGAEIWPVDSEHCALHQCLVGSSEDPARPDVERLWITASGGPFRGYGADELAAVTREAALRHPTWQMGPKITVDSSTLMNKGLEVLEASALFHVEVERIGVVVHPQSIVHSMVEYVDGSVLAQLSAPDMRLAIAYCLGAPERLAHHWGRLDFTQPLHLDFEPPNRELFPALDLAYDCARRGGAAPAWLSAANEVAVEAFLEGKLTWGDIIPLVAGTLEHFEEGPLESVEQLREEDARARSLAHGSLPR
jgi:1-deoxy-D-xylulose-5-phosphate reductoisomerase